MKYKAIKSENKNLCKECGGRCCKNGGCAYIPEDIENICLEEIEKLLDTGRVSIAASLSFKRAKNQKPIAEPTLYIRERDINRDVIDLISVRSACASLENNHCHYTEIDDRPSMGATMIPSFPDECKSTIRTSEFLEYWQPYQKVLMRIVKKRSGMSFDEKLSEDVVELFRKIYSKDLREYESASSFHRMAGLLKSFQLVFPEEAKRGKEKALTNTPFALLRKYQ